MKLEKNKLSRPFPKPTMESVNPNSSSKKPWPCPGCLGFGRIVDPKEERDYVEGYKLASRISCPECKGTGNIGKNYYIELLKEKTKEWRLMEKKRKALQKKAKKIFDNISEEDLKIIESYARSYDTIYNKIKGWPKPEHTEEFTEDELR